MAGIIGRTLRLMLGLLLGWMSYTVMRGEASQHNLRTLAVLAGVTVSYTILHVAIRRYGGRLHRWLGSVLALLPVVLVFALGGPLGRLTSVAFIGASLLLQTIRGDAGAVVLAIPALLTGKPTHLGGILFAPIDWIEKHLTGPGGLPG